MHGAVLTDRHPEGPAIWGDSCPTRPGASQPGISSTLRDHYRRAGGKLYRACGNCADSFQRHVTVDDVILDGAAYVVGINTNFGDTARLTRITLRNGTSTHVCAEFRGVAKGSEPAYLRDGWNDGQCIVTRADVTYG